MGTKSVSFLACSSFDPFREFCEFYLHTQLTSETYTSVMGKATSEAPQARNRIDNP